MRRIGLSDFCDRVTVARSRPNQTSTKALEARFKQRRPDGVTGADLPAEAEAVYKGWVVAGVFDPFQRTRVAEAVLAYFTGRTPDPLGDSVADGISATLIRR